MALGIILRRNTKDILITKPPVVGEIVYSVDTFEHGWLDNTGNLIWKYLGELVIAPGGVLPVLDGSQLTNLPISEIDPDTVIAPGGVLPVLDGSQLTNLPVEYLLSAEFGNSIPTFEGAGGTIWNDNGTVKVSSSFSFEATITEV